MVDGIRTEDLAVCRRMLCGGSRSFHAASLLLPRRVMEPATVLYAFCREADDLVDRGMRVGALAALQWRLDGIYAGAPEDHAADRGLAAVVARHRLPRLLLDGLLEGFAWDAEGRRYRTLGELQAYAARVAGTVGGMMAVLMGAREADVVARACDLGVAMQLSNIARDVGEDARAGRLYLPLEWMEQAGIDPAQFLAAPRFTPALGGVVGRVVAAAAELYARADAGVAALPWLCRPGIGAARRLYAGIGHQVMRAGGNSVDGRAVMPPGSKAAAIAMAIGAAVMPNAAVAGAPLPAVRPFVAAVMEGGTARAPGRVVWLIELFAALESREMASRGVGRGAVPLG